MQVAVTIAEVRAAVSAARESGATIGFVPTMGALHEGHLSLVARSKRETDFTVMSVFVNPLQFGPNEDLSRYPRPVDEDERLAEAAGVDLLFRPEVGDMYPSGRTVTVTAGPLGAGWEGASRPGHFDGVLTVVAKLLNIVQPDAAVFGRKDLQQAALVQALVRDLDIPATVIVAPIIREDDGVAMSSRNRYLGEEDRKRATALNRALRAIRDAYARGERSVERLEQAGRDVLASEPSVRVDYLAVIDPATFAPPAAATDESAAIVAARVGATRLIDNMRLGPDDQD